MQKQFEKFKKLENFTVNKFLITITILLLYKAEERLDILNEIIDKS